MIKLSHSLKWILILLFLALFLRLFIISVFKITNDDMSPILVKGDVVIAFQQSYGFKLPWMQSRYFENNPQINDIVVLQSKNKLTTVFSIQKIIEISNFDTYSVQSVSRGQKIDVARDQIIGKAWFVLFSVNSTQDSISSENGMRWNRFLTLID